MKANKILAEAMKQMEKRAKDRDALDGERSMNRTIKAFNELRPHCGALSERDGWVFMVVLKLARAMTTEKGQLDDYVDAAAYAGLAGELVPEEKPQERFDNPRLVNPMPQTNPPNFYVHELNGAGGLSQKKPTDREELQAENQNTLNELYEPIYGKSK